MLKTIKSIKKVNIEEPPKLSDFEIVDVKVSTDLAEGGDVVAW